MMRAAALIALLGVACGESKAAPAKPGPLQRCKTELAAARAALGLPATDRGSLHAPPTDGPGWECATLYGEAPVSYCYTQSEATTCEESLESRKKTNPLAWEDVVCKWQAKAACFSAMSKLRGEVTWCSSSFTECESMRSGMAKPDKRIDYSSVGKCLAHPGMAKAG